MTGAGAVTAAGHALLGGADDLTAVLADIGTTQHHARLQADLTAVVSGSPDATLSALLDVAADPETRGVARTWRFSPATVRRALDAGHTASSLLDALADISAGELPQPLRYLVADVARQHGSVRASAVACCLRSEDTALLNEIVADRRLRALGLRQLAPTVLAADAPLQDVLTALRNAGYAPVAEAADGTPIVERVIDHRASTDPPRQARANGSAKSRTARPRQAVTRPQPADLARKLLAAPDETLIPLTPSLEAVRLSATNLTTTEARILAHAIDHRQPVTISYVNRDGNPSNRTIDNIELTDGSLLAWCRLRDGERWFTSNESPPSNPPTSHDRPPRPTGVGQVTAATAVYAGRVSPRLGLCPQPWPRPPWAHPAPRLGLDRSPLTATGLTPSSAARPSRSTRSAAAGRRPRERSAAAGRNSWARCRTAAIGTPARWPG
ncbi:helicase-associated domain-containing protein [Asanoa sp. NPDC049518]|uniref:helicase-associated domain-containing protein n=1 Tax=unclassified Asanoa TaxID=2685164 RepID=UPI003428A8D0